MDEVEVDVVEAELLEGASKSGFDGVVLVDAGFGGDEELGARDAGLLDGGAELGLIAVG